MKRVSERSGHDMAAGRQIAAPDKDEMARDLDALTQYRTQVHQRKKALRERREALREAPPAQVA